MDVQAWPVALVVVQWPVIAARVAVGAWQGRQDVGRVRRHGALAVGREEGVAGGESTLLQGG